jgi:GNAT superfamily N-acetyltransferase
MTALKRHPFLLRPPALDDLPAVVELLNACLLDTIGTPSASVEVMRMNWQQPGFDYTRDVRLAVEGSQMVGFCLVSCSPPYVSNGIYAQTHPAHRDHGVGAALTKWGEERIAENIPLAPPNARVTANCSNFGTHTAGAALLLDLGYRRIRSGYEMKIEMAGPEGAPPPPAAWPAGVTVRSMSANQEEEAVFRAADETMRDHWGYVAQPFEQAFAKWLHFVRNVPDYDPDFFWLALDGDQIAGIALCFPKDNDFPDMCWVQSLGVRRPWRRRGLALALLHHVFGECHRRGILKVGLGVDAESLTGATRLYEKAGMHIFRQWDSYEKELRPGEDLTTQRVIA